MKHTPWVAAKNKVIIGYYDTKSAAYEALERLAGKDVTERYNMTFADVYDAWRAEYFGDIAQSARRRTAAHHGSLCGTPPPASTFDYLTW